MTTCEHCGARFDGENELRSHIDERHRDLHSSLSPAHRAVAAWTKGCGAIWFGIFVLAMLVEHSTAEGGMIFFALPLLYLFPLWLLGVAGIVVYYLVAAGQSSNDRS